MSLRPSPTLYISNLETSTKKPELKAQLYSLFNPLDVVAKKHGGGRGQAFIVFEEQAAATAAMRGLAGEEFYNHDLRITYAKTPSNATLSRTDPSASREAAAIQAAKLVVSRAQGEYEQLEKEREEVEGGAGVGKRVLDDADGGGGGGGGKKARLDDGDREGEEDDDMEMEMEDEDDAPVNGSGPSGTTLICTNLPPECTEDVMSALFSQYAGFSKTTPLPPTVTLPPSHSKPNPGAKAFIVTFDSPEHAEAAVTPNKGFLMQPGWEMGVSVK